MFDSLFVCLLFTAKIKANAEIYYTDEEISRPQWNAVTEVHSAYGFKTSADSSEPDPWLAQWRREPDPSVIVSPSYRAQSLNSAAPKEIVDDNSVEQRRLNFEQLTKYWMVCSVTMRLIVSYCLIMRLYLTMSHFVSLCVFLLRVG